MPRLAVLRSIRYLTAHKVPLKEKSFIILQKNIVTKTPGNGNTKNTKLVISTRNRTNHLKMCSILYYILSLF